MTTWSYQPFYCEENVWQLLHEPRFAGDRRYALFITNTERQVAVWQQRLAPRGELVVWDYHVVALVEGPCVPSPTPHGERPFALVWDLDSRLSLPCPLHRYLARTFCSLPPGQERLAPRFRLVPLHELTQRFATDRHHMRAADGSWLQPPPAWPPPAAPGESDTLARFLDLDDLIAGEVMSLTDLAARFAVLHR